MPTAFDWVLLAYRLPREPSTPRITVWRKLKRLGVAHVVDGLVALPADSRTREQLEWIADDVIAAGGSAMIWIGRPGSAAQQRTLAAGMAVVIAAEYRSIIDEAGRVESAGGVERRRSLARLRRELHRIAQRDHFPPLERDLAIRAVADLGRLAEVTA